MSTLHHHLPPLPNRSADWPQAQGLPLRKIAFCRRNARSRGEWFLPKAGGLEGFDDTCCC